MTIEVVRRLARSLPESVDGRRLLAINFVDAVGTGVYMAGAVVFLVRVVGLGNREVGLAMTLAGVVGLLLAVPMGAVADHVGTKRMMVVLQFWRASCFAALAFCGDFVTFVVIASAASVAETTTGAVAQAIVPRVVGQEARVRTLALIRSVRNAGISIGALVTAPLLAVGTTTPLMLVVLANAASFVLTGVLMTRLTVREDADGATAGGRTGPLQALRGFRDWRYVGLTALNVLYSLHLTLLLVVVPLWVLAATDAPVWIMSVLLVVNTVMAVALQVPLSRPAETVHGSVRLMRLAGVALAVCCVAMIAASHSPGWLAVALLVAGIAVMTLGEIWQSAAAWTLSYRFARPTQRVQYLAVFGLSGLLAQDVIGPYALGGVMIDSGWVGSVVLTAVLLAGIPLLGPVVAGLSRREDEEAARAAAAPAPVTSPGTGPGADGAVPVGTSTSAPAPTGAGSTTSTSP